MDGPSLLLAQRAQRRFLRPDGFGQRASGIPQRVPWPGSHNEIALLEQLLRLAPGTDVFEGIHAYQKIQLVRLGNGSFETTHGLNRIIRNACGGVEERRNKALVLGRCQSQHGKTVLEVGQLALLLVRREIGRRKVDPAQVEFVGRSACHSQMTEMNGIECAAEKSDFHLTALPLLEGGSLGDASRTLRLPRLAS